jgi:hypothetical protein
MPQIYEMGPPALDWMEWGEIPRPVQLLYSVLALLALGLHEEQVYQTPVLDNHITLFQIVRQSLSTFFSIHMFDHKYSTRLIGMYELIWCAACYQRGTY